MSRARDLTRAQFAAALLRHGMSEKQMGYVAIDGITRVCKWNAGRRRREQLAYLLREQERAVKARKHAAAQRASAEMEKRAADRDEAERRGLVGHEVSAFVDGAAYQRGFEEREREIAQRVSAQMNEALMPVARKVLGGAGFG